jgi:hypothetical protein
MTRAMLLLLLLACLPARAGAELLLEDGQVLRGSAVERKDELYYLQLETDGVLPVPVALVKEVRLTGADDPPATGMKEATPRALAGPPGAPAPPDRTRQTEALGEPASFRRGAVDTTFVPTSDLDLSLEKNQFNPTRWFSAPIDPSWIPYSAYRAGSDVTHFNPVRWTPSPIDATWWPADGFEKSLFLFPPAPR